MITTDTPDVVARYLRAADARDARAVADCFTPDGTVLDEGKTYTGREAIFDWREHGVSQWTYTTTITGSRPDGDSAYQVNVDVDGNFPGGHAALTYLFTLSDGLISDLRIV
jgi:ketosteroid isomerase-like protein